MGGKLSKKKKGYDVSDPKDKKDETATPAASAEESGKVADEAPTSEAHVEAESANVEEETLGSAVAAVTEVAKTQEEPTSDPPEEKEITPAPASEEPVTVKDEPVLAPEEPNPIIEEAAPAPKEPVSVNEEVASVPEQQAIVKEEATPVLQEQATVKEETTPALDDSLTVEEEIAVPTVEPVPFREEAVVVKEEKIAGVEEESNAVLEEPGTILEERPTLTEAISSLQEESTDQEAPPIEVEPENTVVPEPVEEPATAEENVNELQVAPSSPEEELQEPEPIPVTVSVDTLPPPSTEELQTLSEPVREEETLIETEIEKVAESVPEKVTEPEQEFDTKEQGQADEPEPAVVPDNSMETEIVHAEENHDKSMPLNDDSAEQDITEPVEPNAKTEASEEDVPCTEDVGETKIENGDMESSPITENVMEVAALPVVNGECKVSTTPKECVNGIEELVESPVKKLSDFELKTDINLGDVQEAPEAADGMTEALSTEITQEG
ncbi:uncharacterized protein LOC144194846 [Stigmatopora nigra]